MTCDASYTAYGCLLSQPSLNSGEPEQLISAYSRTTSPAEKNYSPTTLELSALCWALTKTSQYTLGRKLSVFTDHKALTFLFTQKHTNTMLERFMDIILRYDFEVIYKPGVDNVIADTLSRTTPAIYSTTISTDDSITTTSYNLLIPDHKRKEYLTQAHALRHYGETAMFAHLWNRNIWWPSIKSDLSDLVRTCSDCQRHNIGRRGYHPLHSIEALLPCDHMAVDLVGPLPTSTKLKFTYLLVIIDIFTHFVVLRPLVQKTANNVALELWSIFSILGFSRTLQSDNGLEFINSIIKELTNLNGIDHRTLSPYHPRANGLVERTNGTIITSLKKHIQGYDASWAHWIPFIQFSYNSKTSALTGSTPFTLLFNRSPYPTLQSQDRKDNTSIDTNTAHPTTNDYNYWKDQHQSLVNLIYPEVNKRIAKKKAQSIQAFTKNHLIIKNPYPLGALVMLFNHTRSSKLEPIYEGPYTIIQTDRNFTYTVRDNAHNVKTKVPISHMKLISKIPIDLSALPDSFLPPPGDSADIKAILAHSPFENTFDYLVQWKDSLLSNTWIPADSFDDIQIIRDYWKSIKSHHGSNSTTVKLLKQKHIVPSNKTLLTTTFNSQDRKCEESQIVLCNSVSQATNL